MTKSHNHWGHICRLLLLIVLLGVGSASYQVNGASLGSVPNPLQNANLNFNNIVKVIDETKMNSDGITTQIRKSNLYSSCTRRFVQIDSKGPKGIKARANLGEESARLVFESTHRGTMKIHGEHTGYYMCFNRRGKLIARQNGNKLSCEFKEEYSEQNKLFLRTADERYQWYVGFKRRNGRPYKGSARKRFPSRSRKQNCFMFLKINEPDENTCLLKNREGPAFNVCHGMFANIFNKSGKTKSRAIRHEKHHKKRRKG